MGASKSKLETSDFSSFPNLVVILLGMLVRTLYGLETLLGL